jgi:putative FmdB family regulatory protein
MPTYEYRCTAGHTFEVFQSMSEDPVTKCEVCGKPVERVFHAPAVHFKGSGFYTTDYARKGSSKPSGDSKDSKDASSKDSKSSRNGSDSKSSSSDSKAKASDSGD